jgi:hypothetical protein
MEITNVIAFQTILAGGFLWLSLLGIWQTLTEDKADRKKRKF